MRGHNICFYLEKKKEKKSLNYLKYSYFSGGLRYLLDGLICQEKQTRRHKNTDKNLWRYPFTLEDQAEAWVCLILSYETEFGLFFCSWAETAHMRP